MRILIFNNLLFSIHKSLLSICPMCMDWMGVISLYIYIYKSCSLAVTTWTFINLTLILHITHRLPRKNTCHNSNFTTLHTRLVWLTVGSVSLPFRCGGPTVDTAGDEAWPKHLKEACSPEESSEAPFSFFCCSSYERMDCRASCFLCGSAQVIIGGGHSSRVRNNIYSGVNGGTETCLLKGCRAETVTAALTLSTGEGMKSITEPSGPYICIYLGMAHTGQG